jgi:hypothetical protein
MGHMQKWNSKPSKLRRESKAIDKFITRPIRASYTIDLGSIEPAKEFHYFRKVRYFKGKRYVYHTRIKNVEHTVVQNLTREILAEIDREIMKELINGVQSNNTKTASQKIDNMARKEIRLSNSDLQVPKSSGTRPNRRPTYVGAA